MKFERWKSLVSDRRHYHLQQQILPPIKDHHLICNRYVTPFCIMISISIPISNFSITNSFQILLPQLCISFISQHHISHRPCFSFILVHVGVMVVWKFPLQPFKRSTGWTSQMFHLPLTCG